MHDIAQLHSPKPPPRSAPDEQVRRNRFWAQVYLLTISLTLPLTIVALWLLTLLPLWPNELDINGLIAISVGILGILIFYIFLYKFQINSTFTYTARWLALILHALVVILQFIILIWLGFESPWREVDVWGLYDLHEAAKPWIIAVLVIGTITLLGSLFDFLRKRLSGEYKKQG